MPIVWYEHRYVGLRRRREFVHPGDIPTYLRPGGVNPFGDLYEVLSIGLHDLDDDQCCDIVDAMDKSLNFIYTRLKTHVQEAKLYEEAAKSLNAKVAQLRRKASK